MFLSFFFISFTVLEDVIQWIDLIHVFFDETYEDGSYSNDVMVDYLELSE